MKKKRNKGGERKEKKKREDLCYKRGGKNYNSCSLSDGHEEHVKMNCRIKSPCFVLSNPKCGSKEL